MGETPANNNLKINLVRTKVMVISKSEVETNIQIDNNKLEQVKEFVYFEITIDNKVGH